MAAIQTALSARVSKPAGIVSGEVPVWNGTTWVRSSVTPIGVSSLALAPGTEVAYNEATTTTPISATTEGTANTVVTNAAPVSYDGSTAVFIEFFAPYVQTGTTAGDGVVVVLYEDGASIGFFGQIQAAGAGNNMSPMRLSRKRTPAAGTHTYSVRAYKLGTGNGSVGAGAGGTAAYQPAFMRIVRA